MKHIILLSSLLLSFNSLSAEISFNWLKTTSGENSALSGSCDYVGSTSDLNCNLKQVSVRKKSSPEEVKEDIKSVIAEIDNQLKTKTIEQFKKVEFGDFCSKLPENQNKVEKVIFDQFMTMCNNTTRQTVIEALSLTAKQAGKTCKVMDYDLGNFIFNQVNENKWVSTNKPSGNCGSVTVMSLERNPEYATLWSYSQIRHYTNTETEMCKSLAEINEPIAYSWNGQSNIKMDCEYIEFGM
jgi:hypothetical protein